MANTANEAKLYEAFQIALADEDFMDDNKKIGKAVEALTPKDDLTRVFKQLQKNGLKDYLLEKDKGNVADTPEAKASHVKGYVTTKFKKHMTNPKTADKSTKIFNAAYPPKVEGGAPKENPADDMDRVE